MKKDNTEEFLDRIRELFIEYGDHLPWCRTQRFGRYSMCSCGFNDASLVSGRRQVDLPIARRRKTDWGSTAGGLDD